MNKFDQKETPLLTAIIDYVNSNPVPFDVPGHKMGRLSNELMDFIGQKTYQMDVNAPLGIDNLYKGTGVVQQASILAADAFGADKAIFLINGTTSGILTMIMGTVKAKEKIILPRNVHKSAINALILSGAYPIFVKPQYDNGLGIANGVSLEEYVKVMDENPDAVAVFIINPTYFGVVSDLKQIVEEAHKRNMIVLVDEAHGSHLLFNDHMPLSAMEADADVAACSIHKTVGSLTQSSLLLMKEGRVNYHRLRRTYAMFGSTSPSHLLLASIDAARKKIFFEGNQLLEDCLKMAKDTRDQLNDIDGLWCMDKSYCKNNPGCFDFDETKLVIKVSDLGLTGFEVYRIMREKYNIQLELAEICLVLAIVSPGTKSEDLNRLIAAFKDIASEYRKIEDHKVIKMLPYTYPETYCRPREAYHAPNKMIKIEDAIGEISAESVMIYPPGIPILIPGEIIPSNIVELYDYYEEHGGVIMSDSKLGYVRVIDQEEWGKDDEI